MRESATNHMTVPCTFPLRKSSLGFRPFNPEGLAPLGLPLLYGFLPSVWVGVFEVEKDECALWSELDPWLKLQESPFEHCPFAFHWKHSPTFLSGLTLLPFEFWPILLFQFFHSGLWNYVSLLTSNQYVVLPFSSIFDSSSLLYLDSINSWLYKANTFILYKPSRTLSWGDRHSVSKWS